MDSVKSHWLPVFSKLPTINSALFFSRDFMVHYLGNVQFAETLVSIRKKSMLQFDLNNSDYAKFSKRFAQIYTQSQKESPHQKRLIANGIMQLLLEMDNIYQKDNTGEQDLNRAQQLTYRFKDLMSQHISYERNISFYAEKLTVTAKHLSETLKRETGKSASQLIMERTILESKVLLQDLDNSASQVAYALSFSNASQFGKYFKNCTGLSPGAYRKKLR